MSVTSVTAGTGGVTVTGPTTQPVINIPTPVTAVTAGANITLSGAALAPQVSVTSPLTLSAPLVLGSTIPSAAGQLGFSFSVPYSGPANFSNLTNDVYTTYGTTTVSTPGVYMVSCTTRFTLPNGINAVNAEMLFTATGVTVGDSVALQLPLSGANFTTVSPCVLSNTVLVVVPPSTTSTFTLSVKPRWVVPGTTNTPFCETANYRFIVTRIA